MSKDYVVQAGDTLGHIAMREYGAARHWPRIAHANKLYRYPRNPDLIFPGEVLQLPQ